MTVMMYAQEIVTLSNVLHPAVAAEAGQGIMNALQAVPPGTLGPDGKPLPPGTRLAPAVPGNAALQLRHN
jgi:hypothetical protein